MTDTISLDEIREHAAKTWRTFTEARNLRATLAWAEPGQTQDSSQLLSARVTGPGAANALQRFTADYHLILGAPGDQRPNYDYSDLSRVACVWRKSGVWIELWVPEGVVSEPEPAAAPVQATSAPSLSESVASALRGLGDRLPTTRRKKETTTA